MYIRNQKFLWRPMTFIVLGCCLSNIVISTGYCFQINGKNEFYPSDAVRINAIEVIQSSDRRSIDVSNDYVINSKGYIMMPLIGSIKVVGHNRYSLAKFLMERYSPYFKEPYIMVTPLIRVTLMGAFNKPGSYRVSPQSSLWELIELAEGPKENCDLNSMRVERGGKVINKNLLASFEKGYSLEDINIRSGDQIIAKAKSNFGFREIMSYAYIFMTAVSLYVNIRSLN